MKLFQLASTFTSIDSAPLMSVDDATFAELHVIDEDQSAMLFDFSFKISLTNTHKNPADYSRVVVTVKRDESQKVSKFPTALFSNVAPTSAHLAPVSNNVAASFSATVNSGPIYPRNLASKIYSGLNAVKALEKKEEIIDRQAVGLSSHVADAVGNNFVVTDISAPQFRESAGINSSQIRSKIDVNSIISRINSDLVDITDPAFDEFTSGLTSDTDLDDADERNNILDRGRGKSLYYDIVKYYLDDVKRNSLESDMTWYVAQKTTRQLSDIDLTATVSLPKSNRNSNLVVRFDLYKRDNDTPEETVTKSLHVANHVSAYYAVQRPPIVRASIHDDKPRTCSLTIIDRETQRKVSGYDVYLKSIDDAGTTSQYRQIAAIRNTSRNSLVFPLESDLSIVRVVPLDTEGRESSVFTNVALGPGYPHLEKLTILPSHTGKNSIDIEVNNIPNGTTSLDLYRRSDVGNISSPAVLIRTIRRPLAADNAAAKFTDNTSTRAITYEYYVVATAYLSDKNVPMKYISNYVTFNSKQSVEEKESGAISVKISDFLAAIETSTSRPGLLRPGTPSLSFAIKTTVSPTENERITNILREQLGELYKKYIDPANNTSSPLGDITYADLFFHEVVRTNLNTGDRETFDIVSDGTFQDNQVTRATSNVKIINLQHTYKYQVFTYRKNPIELFKNFVTVDPSGKWYLLPYKWNNPVVQTTGKLYADDVDGIPIIDSYSSFTSNSFGLTASYTLNASTQFTAINQIIADRVDRNTVKITWNVTGVAADQLYDSFVVLKTVNGVRSFAGRTHKNYMFHDLAEGDVGTIYYTIVPIMSEFDINEAGHSRPLLIEPSGLTHVTKVPPVIPLLNVSFSFT